VPAHGWKATDIVSDFTCLWSQGRCDQVYVDYLDLIPYDTRGNMSEQIGLKLGELKNGAAACKWHDGDGGIPLVVTGQPTKGFDESERPTMGDAFGSVRIQQFASKFLTMWRERDQQGRPTGDTLVRIEKNPDGGHEGAQVALRGAGDADHRGYVFYPIHRPDIERG
jgi:hypothetical protein